MAFDTVQCQTPDLRPEKRLEDLVQLLRADDRDDELQEAPPPGASTGSPAGGVGSPGSGRTRIAPSPRVYASSPCCVTSRPRPSSRAVALKGPARRISF